MNVEFAGLVQASENLSGQTVDLVGQGHGWPSAGLVEDALKPGCVASPAEIDHSNRRVVVQSDRIGINPVADLVTVEHGEHGIELNYGHHEVGPAVPSVETRRLFWVNSSITADLLARDRASHLDCKRSLGAG